MPYIPKTERKTYDPLIDNIVKELTEYFPAENGKGYSEGQLNYVISSIIWKLFDKNKNYANANKLLGALNAVKLEFYRRRVAPYEDLKIIQNGDI